MDVADYEGADDEKFWASHEGVDEATRIAIDGLRPARPFGSLRPIALGATAGQ